MPSRLIVRPTTQGDIAAVTAIYSDAVHHGTASYEIDPPSEAEMLRRWRDLREKNFPHLVGVRDDYVVGYAYAGPYRPRPAYRYSVEDSVYVAPAAQGSGVGSALLGMLIEICEAAGFRQMIAVIGDGAGNAASVGLHRRLGFREIGVFEGSGFKHGRWLDTVFMQRALGPGITTPPGN